MAKGNMLLGYSQGSVGDVVMSRVKGQQVAKARNRKPANPKSNKQMQQRSSFISPVKFFTHGVQALFKFAFSDKKVTESDFNAFMRHNAKAAFPVTKAENDDPGFPAVGNYMMSKGKLPEIPTVKIDNRPLANAIPLGVRDYPVTIGQLSTAFISQGYAEEGDIITFVAIDLKVYYADEESIDLLPGEIPKWTIYQFIVDSSNTEYWPISMPHLRFLSVDGNWFMELTNGFKTADTLLHAFACIRSRETALGLEVSTSYLHNASFIDDYIAFRNTKAQVDKVLADWGATGDAILQGSIAKK